MRKAWWLLPASLAASCVLPEATVVESLDGTPSSAGGTNGSGSSGNPGGSSSTGKGGSNGGSASDGGSDGSGGSASGGSSGGSTGSGGSSGSTGNQNGAELNGTCYPLCEEGCIDPDGDELGWNGEHECVIPGASDTPCTFVPPERCGFDLDELTYQGTCTPLCTCAATPSETEDDIGEEDGNTCVLPGSFLATTAEQCVNGEPNGVCASPSATTGSFGLDGRLETGTMVGYPTPFLTGPGQSSISPNLFAGLTPDSPLCTCGTVGTDPNYESGAGVRITLSQPACNAAILPLPAPDGEGLNFEITSSSVLPLRVEIWGENGATNPDERWCTMIEPTPGVQFRSWDEFENACWDLAPGPQYDGQNLINLSVVVPSDTNPINYDFCIKSIEIAE